MTQPRTQPKRVPNAIKWIPLSHSTMFLLRHKTLLGWSTILVIATWALTYLGFHFGLEYINTLTGDFFFKAPETSNWIGWVKYGGWYLGKILFLLISHVVTFYLAFLLAFSLTTPGYVFLSHATEKKQKGNSLSAENAFSLKNIIRDLLEGFKVGAFGILVAIASIMVSFIPVIGQASVFIMYTYYSALMFLDYPTSRRGWTLGEKINWLRIHNNTGFRLGFLPALASMIPILNIFLIALLFPVLTVHTTLNFTRIEDSGTR